MIDPVNKKKICLREISKRKINFIILKLTTNERYNYYHFNLNYLEEN